MPEHVIELTSDAFKECKKTMQNSHILILGVSYKPNVKDVQLSPAEHIVRKFQNLGVNVHIYDPYFISTEVFGIWVEENIDDDAEFASGEKADVAFDDPVDGIINTGDDADCFRFTATMEKDIRLDGLLQLYNTNGNLLAESDNHELPVLYPLDPPLNYIIPEDGIYYAVVTSVYMERGIEHTYALTLSNTEIPNDERDDLQ